MVLAVDGTELVVLAEDELCELDDPHAASTQAGAISASFRC
ncbi:MAG TPA: hypothetical protein VLP43_12345 [Solirubrobacteraceae bacterium]|nr:hypothetical protein [Solirubrobacteraceae bacterium]